MALSPTDKQAIQSFQERVVIPSQSKLVILDFFAEWCGPCKQLTPVLEEIADQYAKRGVELVKVDVDKEEFISQQYQIRSMPTVYVIHGGKPIANMTNIRTVPQISSVLDDLIKTHGINAAA